ncbi:MAG: hypothetical protein HN521_05130 [Candidatus Latescibacteria bacterium]|jgi:uncharacterized RDD family membrane protein YckC|nr:hypothetical protein [Candidatus Latescibacterota bacterium]MBT5829799.1 hypothetical protein [Candidatus Latescibacterota bacterium]
MEDAIADDTFKARLATYSLSELEDVLAHVDRDLFPGREALVTQAIDERLAEENMPTLASDTGLERVPPSFLRRFTVSLIDLSVQVVIPYIILYFVVKVIYTPLGKNKLIQYLFPPKAAQRGGGRRGRGGGSNDVWSDISGWWDSFYGFIVGVTSGEPESISTLVVVGEYFIAYFIFRLFWTSWRLSRSGATSGMKEAGVRLIRSDGTALLFILLIGRFILHYALFFVTFGVSGLWMFWDKEKRGLHDRLLGTQLVRVSRSWEKGIEERKFD